MSDVKKIKKDIKNLTKQLNSLKNRLDELNINSSDSNSSSRSSSSSSSSSSEEKIDYFECRVCRRSFDYADIDYGDNVKNCKICGYNFCAKRKCNSFSCCKICCGCDEDNDYTTWDDSLDRYVPYNCIKHNKKYGYCVFCITDDGYCIRCKKNIKKKDKYN